MTVQKHHIPVLLQEVVTLLQPKQDEVFVDCTVGLGGHAAAIAGHLGVTGTAILNDADPANLDHAKAYVESLAKHPKLISFRGNFAELPWRFKEQGLSADILLADLGFASSQMDDAGRGFSFMRDGPLDMRLDPTLPTSAADLVNSLPESELARILLEYGEEGASKVIARKLVQQRRIEPINSTSQLADLVRGVVRNRTVGIDPSTKTFQALRIAVNDELGSLDALLGAIRLAASGKSVFLKPGARVGIISFHSLEDRPVKRAFAAMVSDGIAEDVSNGGVRASEQEVEANPRSRSATLRVIRILPKGSGQD